LKGPPKWGFGVILGVGAKIFGGKVHPSSEFRVSRHLWSRSDAPCRACMGIAICQAKIWASLGVPAPPEVAGKHSGRKAPLWTFDYHMEKS